MWLTNTDKEVERFHPVCIEAFEGALQKLHLENIYEVQHHRHVGTIEMDVVVANKATNKILCVVEVKRTVAAVNSTRYQFQAMSYVQSMRDAELESKYYILTNLESSCLFKYDQGRPNVYEQIIEPGITMTHRFHEVDKTTFMADLTAHYAHLLTTIINDSGRYLLTFKSFVDEIQDRKDSKSEWNKTLAGLFYEYIRGSFSKINRKGLRTISKLSNKVDLVCREALKINFSDIFSQSSDTDDRNIHTSKVLLNQLYELGRTYVDADELANIMHRVISERHRHEGEVPTDTELANAIMWIVKSVTGELGANEKIMDPAAGSGSLICASLNVFNNITPSQIVANDINDKLLQLLSLRIGLKFASTVEKNNTASITGMNIADMPASNFDNVRIIVMNPPYLSAVGVNCTERKSELYQRIRSAKKSEPTTIGGQMPLEGPFVELVSALAKEDTIIATIIPNTHLTTRGDASVAIRRMLLDDFGLQMIFTYPQENLFEDVAQNTSVLIGIKGSHPENIRYLYSNEILSEIDTVSIKEALNSNFSRSGLENINQQFEGALIPVKELQDTIASGWHIGNMTRESAQNFIKYNLNTAKCLATLKGSEYSYLRGKVGNSGCTKLLFLKPDSTLTIKDSLKGHTAPGVNNAKYKDLFIGDGDSLFVNVAGMDDSEIENLVKEIMQSENSKGKKQRQDNKSMQEYIKTLKMESGHISPADCVLLPRMIRSNGRVFITEKPTYVSTNFFVIQADKERARLLASWFASVFYQLECEAYGNNRKGLRKLEKEDYETLHVPITNQLTNEQRAIITATPINEFINLRQPRLREIDMAWARILFGERAEEFAEEALSQLAVLVADREK